MRPDAERFLRPGDKLDRYWERPEYQPPTMRAYAKPPAPGRVAGYAQDQSFAGAVAPVPESEPSHGELRKLKSDLAALRVQLAVIKHEVATRKAQGRAPLTEADEGWQIILRSLARYEDACRKAGFNPDQPRVPAGNPDGGQWTSGSGAGGRNTSGGSNTGGGINDPRVLSDATPDNEWIPGARYAQNDQLVAYGVDLREEQARGGHTIEKHVNRSREALIAQAREAFAENPFAQDSRSGSFSSLEAATKLINSTLSKNQAIVDQVASGDSPAAVVSASFGSVTGIEAVIPNRRSQPNFRETYGVGVVIIHDKLSLNGFTVWTAFPSNR